MTGIFWSSRRESVNLCDHSHFWRSSQFARLALIATFLATGHVVAWPIKQMNSVGSQQSWRARKEDPGAYLWNASGACFCDFCGNFDRSGASRRRQCESRAREGASCGAALAEVAEMRRITAEAWHTSRRRDVFDGALGRRVDRGGRDRLRGASGDLGVSRTDLLPELH
jgi:hypothetical protein